MEQVEINRFIAQTSLKDLVTKKLELTFDGVPLHNNFKDLNEQVIGPCSRALIGYVMRRTGGNQVHTSVILGINRNTLRKRLGAFCVATVDQTEGGIACSP